MDDCTITVKENSLLLYLNVYNLIGQISACNIIASQSWIIGPPGSALRRSAFATSCLLPLYAGSLRHSASLMSVSKKNVLWNSFVVHSTITSILLVSLYNLVYFSLLCRKSSWSNLLCRHAQPSTFFWTNTVSPKKADLSQFQLIQLQKELSRPPYWIKHFAALQVNQLFCFKVCPIGGRKLRRAATSVFCFSCLIILHIIHHGNQNNNVLFVFGTKRTPAYVSATYSCISWRGSSVLKITNNTTENYLPLNTFYEVILGCDVDSISHRDECWRCDT